MPETMQLCTAVPAGATTPAKGATVESLQLLPGYYRTSAHSRVIEQCLQPHACTGGVLPTEYCAAGYTGICEDLQGGGRGGGSRFSLLFSISFLQVVYLVRNANRCVLGATGAYCARC